MLSLWQQILEQEVVGHKPSNIIKEYKQIREYLNEEAKKENEEKKECPISISPQPQMNCSKFGFKKIENKNFCYKKKSSCRGNLTNIIHLSTLKTKIIQCKKICQNIGIEKCKLFEFDRIEKNCKTFDFDFKNETILHRKSNKSYR